MSTLTLDAASSTLATIDLGESDRGYFDGADLAETGGNLYIHIDGQEYGSLFFHRDRETGRITVALGAYDTETQQWEERATLDGPNFPADAEV